nr:hypothetical protein [Tanacetum cinerariifolium]
MMEKLFGMELELIRLFWSTAMAKTINGEVQLHAKVDGKKIIVTESSVRRDLRHCLPNSTIFEQLALMGKPKREDTQVPQPSGPTESIADEAVHKELEDSLVRVATTTSSLEAERDSDQDSLNADAGGNLLEKSPQDALTIIENKSKQTSVVTTAMTAMLKQFQSNPPPAQVKAVEEICVTCGGAHPYYQCLAPVATLSQNTGIIFKVTFQRPQVTTIRVIQVIVLKV